MKNLILTMLLFALAVPAQAQDSAFDEDLAEMSDDDTKGKKAAKASSDESEDSKVPTLDVSRELETQFSAALKSKSDERVVSAASKILGRDPNHLSTLNGLGVYYYSQNKINMARLLFQRALKAHPDNLALQNNLGVLYLAENEVRLALETFKKASKAGSSSRGAANLSYLYVNYGDYERAVGPMSESYDELKGDLKRSNSISVAVANNYAVALMGTGKGERAESIFETMVESGIRVPEVYINYAILLIDVLKKKSDAQKILSKIQFMTEDAKILRKVSELEARAR